jgi:inner membrane protein
MEEKKLDPISHAIIGLGVGALSGQPITLYNPLYCAAIMGAIMPDIDVVTMLKGDLSFIRNHRGITHSLGGFLLLSAIISAIIFVDFGGSMLQYFYWAFFGAVSHGILDFFNSYGTKLLWPFSGKRQTGNLLMFFDPILIILFLPVIFAWQNPQKAALIGFSGIILYLFVRLKMRQRVESFLKKAYNLKPGMDRLAVMPALRGMFSWDFCIEGAREIIVGTHNYIDQNISNCSHMDRTASPLIFKALQTAPGRLFCQFTSFYHITHWEDKGRYFVKLMDLRFKHKTDFSYWATLIFNDQLSLEEAYFNRLNNLIPMDIR